MRIPDLPLAVALFAVLAFGITRAYAIGTSYEMGWQEEDASPQSAQIAEIRDELSGLGFPSAVLDDLAAEDILACEGALRVLTKEGYVPLTEWDQFVKTGFFYDNYYTVEDVKGLRLTSIAVELPSDTERWKVFHHFVWTENPGFHGTECLQFQPANLIDPKWAQVGEPSGRLLFDRDGKLYGASYHSIKAVKYSWLSESEEISTSTWFMYAAFSLPSGAQRQRGYITYGFEGIEGEINSGLFESVSLNIYFNYTHYQGVWQYPVSSAVDIRCKTPFCDYGDWFQTVHNALSVY